MANKPITQLLKHGTLLTKKAFPFFVEAWNWLFEDFVNLKGDFDLDPQSGHIQRDDSAGFPILRLVNVEKLKDDIKKQIEKEEEKEEEEEENEVVTSLNGETGAITIIGGKGIKVETDGKTIKISYDPNKTEEDEDPNGENKKDPCDHPGGDGSGGVVADADNGGGGDGDGGGAGYGGVPADGESHPGKPCTGETC